MALAIYVAADTNPEAATAMSIMLLAIALVLLGITNRGSATDTSF